MIADRIRANNERAAGARVALGATPIGAPELADLVHSYLRMGYGLSEKVCDHDLILKSMHLALGSDHGAPITNIYLLDPCTGPNTQRYEITISINAPRALKSDLRVLIAWCDYSLDEIWDWLTGGSPLDMRLLKRSMTGQATVPPLGAIVANVCEGLRQSLYQESEPVAGGAAARLMKQIEGMV